MIAIQCFIPTTIGVKKEAPMGRSASRGGRHPGQGNASDETPGATFEQWPADIDFGALGDLIGYALRRAQIAIYQDFFATVGTLDLTPQLFAALVLIDGNPDLNQSGLGRIMGINRAASMALVKRLEDLGLVARVASKADRRANTVALTALGKKRLPQLIAAVRDHDARVSRNLSAQELANLRRLLGKF
jgi:DNA-binding MarR family transcriptional regulator